MTPDIFPKYRHIVVVGEKRFPAKVLRETYVSLETTAGTFMKASRRFLGDSSVRYEGPFTVEGDMEDRP